MPIYALGDLTPQIDPSAYVSPEAVLIGNVVLGPESSVWPGAVLRGDHGLIEVGARTSIQDGSVLHTTEHWPTIVGPDCVVGHLVHIEGATIGERSLVGSGSIVMNRVTVEPRAVIGAAALVAEDTVVPSDHLAVGVPAKLKPIPDPTAIGDWMTYAIDFYVSNAATFAKQLRRLD